MALLLGSSSFASGQVDTPKRLRSPANINGTIGGESHDSYVIRARKGQTMTVRISWRQEGDNRVDFSVSRAKSFFDSTPLKFGKESNNGKTWTGKIPTTRDYYIYVTAHPIADYKLRVTVK